MQGYIDQADFECRYRNVYCASLSVWACVCECECISLTVTSDDAGLVVRRHEVRGGAMDALTAYPDRDQVGARCLTISES
jgi:hypothetical protein